MSCSRVHGATRVPMADRTSSMRSSLTVCGEIGVIASRCPRGAARYLRWPWGLVRRARGKGWAAAGTGPGRRHRTQEVAMVIGVGTLLLIILLVLLLT